MDMSMQLARTCQAAYFQTDACKTIVHGLVTSKLDYGNAMLCVISGQLLHKRQRVQNSAARVITQQRRRDHLHITPVLIVLHWLPVP